MTPAKKRGRKAVEEEAAPNLSLPDRIVLTGFMCTGKSTVGRRLAELMKRPFVDLDRVIESSEGITVAELISRLGEPAFRAIESREAARIARLPRTVVATGGGTLLNETNRARLLAGDARVFLLTASVEELLRRLAHEQSQRPLLAGGDLRERVETLLAEREAAYAAVGEVFDTTGKTVDESAREILLRIAPAIAAIAPTVSSEPGAVSAGGEGGAEGAAEAAARDNDEIAPAQAILLGDDSVSPSAIGGEESALDRGASVADRWRNGGARPPFDDERT